MTYCTVLAHKVSIQQTFTYFMVATFYSNVELSGYLRKRVVHLQKFAQIAGVKEFREPGSYKISNNFIQ